MNPKIFASKGARGTAGWRHAISRAEDEIRQAIIDMRRRMNAPGIERGTSGGEGIFCVAKRGTPWLSERGVEAMAAFPPARANSGE